MNPATLQAVFLIAIALFCVMRRNARSKETFVWIYCVFLFSGFPALIYQIVWERALFAIYGVNVESVTVVVTGFMLGLGLGSLAGGYLSKLRNAPLLALFACAEMITAVYGGFSLRLFHLAAGYSAGSSLAVTSLISFALLLLPTMLMGSTLPLLVEFAVRRSGNVGRSLGELYFVNTIGSAAACFLAAGVTMRLLGQSGSIALAATMNAAVGLTVLAMYLRHHRGLDSRSARPASRRRRSASPARVKFSARCAAGWKRGIHRTGIRDCLVPALFVLVGLQCASLRDALGCLSCRSRGRRLGGARRDQSHKSQSKQRRLSPTGRVLHAGREPYRFCSRSRDSVCGRISRRPVCDAAGCDCGGIVGRRISPDLSRRDSGRPKSGRKPQPAVFQQHRWLRAWKLSGRLRVDELVGRTNNLGHPGDPRSRTGNRIAGRLEAYFAAVGGRPQRMRRDRRRGDSFRATAVQRSVREHAYRFLASPDLSPSGRKSQRGAGGIAEWDGIRRGRLRWRVQRQPGQRPAMGWYAHTR